MTSVVWVALLVTSGAGLHHGAATAAEPVRFTPPGREARTRAIGDTRYAPAEQKKAFSESGVFLPKTQPGTSDWLANHREPGQTFDQFLKTRRNLFRSPRTRIYIQPVGAFPKREKERLDLVKEYATIFFQTEVKLQASMDPEKKNITERLNPYSRNRQFLTTDLLRLLKKELPRDAYARLGVTMTDLYPDPKWNFVFGQASFRERVGVYSFSRYGDPDSTDFLRRCLQVFTHETGHMFTLYHCIFYECLMNGSNHLEESDAAPLHLCPVCLRKLHTAHSFDIMKRYQTLHGFYRRLGLNQEAEWIAKRMETLK